MENIYFSAKMLLPSPSSSTRIQYQELLRKVFVEFDCSIKFLKTETCVLKFLVIVNDITSEATQRLLVSIESNTWEDLFKYKYEALRMQDDPQLTQAPKFQNLQQELLHALYATCSYITFCQRENIRLEELIQKNLNIEKTLVAKKEATIKSIRKELEETRDALRKQRNQNYFDRENAKAQYERNLRDSKAELREEYERRVSTLKDQFNQKLRDTVSEHETQTQRLQDMINDEIEAKKLAHTHMHEVIEGFEKLNAIVNNANP